MFVERIWNWNIGRLGNKFNEVFGWIDYWKKNWWGLKCSLQIGEKIEGKAGPAFERQMSMWIGLWLLLFSSFLFCCFFFFFNLFLLLLRCYGFQFLFYFILFFNFLKTLMWGESHLVGNLIQRSQML